MSKKDYRTLITALAATLVDWGEDAPPIARAALRRLYLHELPPILSRDNPRFSLKQWVEAVNDVMM